MLTQAGITDTNTQLQVNIYLSIWCLFTATLGTCFADKIGRKKLGAGSMAASLIFLYLVGAFTKCMMEYAFNFIPQVLILGNSVRLGRELLRSPCDCRLHFPVSRSVPSMSHQQLQRC